MDHVPRLRISFASSAGAAGTQGQGRLVGASVATDQEGMRGGLVFRVAKAKKVVEEHSDEVLADEFLVLTF
jgi:hypothetical protein